MLNAAPASLTTDSRALDRQIAALLDNPVGNGG